MSTVQQLQARRMEVLDKMFDPDTKIIATPNPDMVVGMSGLARYLGMLSGILREGYVQVKRNVLFLQHDLPTPNDRFEGALDAFDKDAKSLRIRTIPEKMALKQLAAQHGYRHNSITDLQPLTKHYMS